ncbi:hypothetical protein [Rhodoferax sp.]|uniref:hypothetical protein n=1 Tax=Rhodoferax sp. TaxID=50421 RepID=UPI001A0024AC|nr:hypothetical protein [Rhodoferax sp.]MBE0475347.1 hypothetical protein [Rhodoferax sp.]
MSRPSVWAPKIVALIKGGNSAAALAQIKVAPTVKDLQDLRKLLMAANLLKTQPNVDAATKDMIAELSAPRLHRSP